jgi:putative membrane protein
MEEEPGARRVAVDQTWLNYPAGRHESTAQGVVPIRLERDTLRNVAMPYPISPPRQPFGIAWRGAIMRQDNRGLLVVLGVLVLIVLVGPLLMGGMMGFGAMGPGMMGWGYGTPGGPAAGNTWIWGLGMGLGSLLMLVFWGAVIIGGVLLVRSALGATTAPGRTDADDPLAILRRRYAAGEIDQATFQRMRAELGDPASAPDQTVGANGSAEVPR